MAPKKHKHIAKSTPTGKKPHHRDNRRGSGYNVKPSAGDNRKKMMENAPDCTILRTLDGFVNKFMPRRSGYAAAFKAHFSDATVEAISRRMAEAVGKAKDVVEGASDKDDSVKEAVLHVAEKEITRAWVCFHSLIIALPTELLTS